MITVTDLYKNYNGLQVLKGVNFNVNKGDIYGFIGRNGAGKSTTLNILTGLISQTSGSMNISNKQIGYLPESPMFYDYMTANEYLKFIGTLKKSPNITKRTAELLELVGLSHAKNKRIKTYSRGMKQRLGLASVLFHDPELLLLDEPSSALDPQGRKDILDILLTLKTQGKTIFFSTHILEDVERVCNKIAILDDGIIKLESTVKELVTQYEDPIYKITTTTPTDISLLKEIKQIVDVKKENDEYILYLNQHSDEILKQLTALPITITSFNQKKSTLEDIFIRMVQS